MVIKINMSITPKIQNNCLQLKTLYIKGVIWWIIWILGCYSHHHPLFNWEYWVESQNYTLLSSHIVSIFSEDFCKSRRLTRTELLFIHTANGHLNISLCFWNSENDTQKEIYFPIFHISSQITVTTFCNSNCSYATCTFSDTSSCKLQLGSILESYGFGVPVSTESSHYY